ncbi:hypothetical protein FRC14_007053 [Serendipita sp. 396]|nr:hypothetical protein FRC14_007053 [Serendipita sp. 396]KAG8862375.1 hypothetical protein FRC20_011242 [Serendipita sp. 405]
MPEISNPATQARDAARGVGYNIYARILRQVLSAYEREMKAILVLLAFSRRPMTIQEVREATAVNADKLCSSLVSLSELDSAAISAFLYYAPYYGLLPILDALLRKTIKQTRSGDELESALEAAASGGYVPVAKRLLDKAADVNARFYDYDRRFH